MLGQGILSIPEVVEKPGAYCQVNIKHLDSMTNMYDVFSSDKIVVLDFEGDKCQACRVLSKRIESLNPKFWDNMTVYKINVDVFTGLRESFNVRYLPTLIVVKNGRMLDRIEGSIKPETLECFLSRNL